ncbi:hypothetical protein JCM3766R1_006736 [Sporobolomyces carnicolor]
MLHNLPGDVLDRIICHIDDRANRQNLYRLVLVSTRLAKVVQQHLSRHPVYRSSTATQRGSKCTLTPALAAEALVVGRGSRTKAATVKVGRAKVAQNVEDSVTEEDLVRLCQSYPRLVTLRLEEPRFNSLRRRQVGFAANLDRLTSLSIVGRGDASLGGFSLTTVGQVLEGLSQLRHLELRHLQVSRASLAGLSPPSFQLSSFELVTDPFLRPSQLLWLLSSSTQAESLRTLRFHLPTDVVPFELHSIYWAPIRVTSLEITCASVAPIEAMPLHCPHLRRFTFNLLAPTKTDPKRRVNGTTLLKNALEYGGLRAVEDRSEGIGMDLQTLAEGLLLVRKKLQIARVAVWNDRKTEPGYRALLEVCRLLSLPLFEFSRTQ